MLLDIAQFELTPTKNGTENCPRWQEMASTPKMVVKLGIFRSFRGWTWSTKTQNQGASSTPNKNKKQHHKLLNLELCLPFYLRTTPQEASTQKGMISPPSLGIGVWLGVLGITGKQLRRWILMIQTNVPWKSMVGSDVLPIEVTSLFSGDMLCSFSGETHMSFWKGRESVSNHQFEGIFR